MAMTKLCVAPASFGHRSYVAVTMPAASFSQQICCCFDAPLLKLHRIKAKAFTGNSLASTMSQSTIRCVPHHYRILAVGATELLCFQHVNRLDISFRVKEALSRYYYGSPHVWHPQIIGECDLGRILDVQGAKRGCLKKRHQFSGGKPLYSLYTIHLWLYKTQL